jgi:hypothetical protein
MIVSALRYVNSPPARVRYTGWTWLVLGVLLVGPLVGPLFAWLGWPLLGLINWPLYLMGETVCPQPAFVLNVLGYPMLVCSRCWSGVLGLWIVLLAYRAGAAGPVWRGWLRQPEAVRVGLALAAFAPWVLDIVAADRGWWASDHPAMMLTGVLGGLGAGALVLPFATRR